MKALNLVILVLLSTITYSQTDSTSLRIKAMGTELKWIVEDEYTDAMHNPAAINKVESSFVYVIGRNFPSTDFELSSYADNKYTSNRGAASIGSFIKISDWTIALSAGYGQDKLWEERGYRMSTPSEWSYKFSWAYIDDKAKGIFLNDYSNGTTALIDDWRIYEEREGLNYYRDNEFRRFSIILGKQNWGFSYSYHNTVSATPPNFLQSASHLYRIIEIGIESPNESIYAFQQEINEYKKEQNTHIISFGNSRETKNNALLDISVDLVFASRLNNFESRKEKEVDYDPDTDGEYTFYGGYVTFEKYLFQQQEIFNEEISTLGAQLNTRYTKILCNTLKARLITRLTYFKENNANYSQQKKRMEEMIGDNNSDSYFNSVEADKSKHLFSSLLGLGASSSPIRGLTFGFAAKWYFDYSHTHFENGIPSSIISAFETDYNKSKHNKIAIPVGMEYWIKKWIALRLGMDTHFNSLRQVESNKKFDDYRDDSYLSLQGNTTFYSYGLGLRIFKKLELDLAGISNMSDISNYYISINYRF